MQSNATSTWISSFSGGLVQTRVFIFTGCTLLCYGLQEYSKTCFMILAIHVSTYPSMVSLTLITAPCSTTVLSCGRQPCVLLRVVCSSLSEGLHLLLHIAVLAALQHTHTDSDLAVYLAKAQIENSLDSSSFMSLTQKPWRLVLCYSRPSSNDTKPTKAAVHDHRG